MCEELVRNWLYTKRPLLKATLDHLGVKNDNGLVDEDPVFFQELSAEKVKELVTHLTAQGHQPEHPLQDVGGHCARIFVHSSRSWPSSGV